MTVLLANPTQLKTLEATYPTNTNLPTGAVFRHKAKQFSVTGYRSGKVLFQGHQAQVQAANWPNLKAQAATASKTTAKSKGDKLPPNFANFSVIGSDEVGNGSYFGPLTIAAVYVDKTQLDFVNHLGVADSKTLTDTKIAQIATQLMAKLPYHIVNIMPEKYNAVHQKMNIEKMKAISHNFALLKVYQQIQPQQPDAFLIDQFEPRPIYYRYLADEPTVLTQNVYLTTKAEQNHLAVAAASIIARHQANLSMNELTDKAGFKIPLGNHQAVNEIAAKLLQQGGESYLGQFAKLHFINTKKAQALL